MQRLTKEELSQITLFWHQIIAQTWKDPNFKKQLLAHPKEVLMQYVQDKGAKSIASKLSDNSEIHILEDRKDLYHFVVLAPGTFILERSNYHPEWDQISKKASQDPQFKALLLRDPMAAFKQQGVALPAGTKLKVVENQENLSYLVIPLQPKYNLTEEDLQAVVGAGEYSNI